MGLKYLRAFGNLNSSEKWDLLFINFLIIKYFILTKALPIRYYYNRYFNETYSENYNMQLIKQRISFINRVILHSPIRTNCLINSMVRKAYFNSYNICIPIYIGIKKSGKLTAHAWNFSNPKDYIKLK